MKIIKNILPFVLLSVFLISCGNDKPSDRYSNSKDTENSQQLDNSQASSTVFHYTCPNGHPGSEAAGTCVVCGTELAHNDAYHNTQQPPQQPPLQTSPAIQNQAAGGGQNAAGVYHYVCPAGHSGGAATGGTCSECGQALVHNDAFHK